MYGGTYGRIGLGIADCPAGRRGPAGLKALDEDDIVGRGGKTVDAGRALTISSVREKIGFGAVGLGGSWLDPRPFFVSTMIGL